MITQFPKIYPDELLYSQLARYHVRSGNLAYIFTAEQLFQTKTVRPDVEFLNSYTQDTLSVISRCYNEAYDVPLLWPLLEAGT